ncbi:acyl-CoA thioesterase [Actinotignum sp. GS-2025a]|uniref:acyl-CoA thioesterase n=1 Tax=unclassified Actinotignum TaxID=2632702 RepID=UPI000B35656A|nr:thioesterase family protein [Actinotignum timonense]PLB85097.1 acyl-CoA thioesterase II [Actinotignum timonense]
MARAAGSEEDMHRIDIPETHTEPLASILNNLRLERCGTGRYRGQNLVQITGKVYGGQVLGQATMAAADDVQRSLGIGEDERLAHSITAAFQRAGHLDEPIEFQVEEINDLRSFSTRNVTAYQGDRLIFTARVSFQLRQPGPTLASSMPDVPGPEGLPSSVDFFGALDNVFAKVMSSTNGIDMRRVEGDIYLRPDPGRSPRQHLWLRARSPMPEGTSRTLQRAMLGYSADQFMLEPALRALGLAWLSRGISVATLDHAIWWHRNFDMSEWILAEMECVSAQNGRALVNAKFFQDGRHIASMSQEGMVRVPERHPDHPEQHVE